MATTVYYCASSLDGYIAEADDGLDWLLEYDGTFEHEAADADPVSDGGGYEDFTREFGRCRLRHQEWILDHLDVAGGGQWALPG